MKIGIPVYEGVDLLDVTGPYELLNWLGSAQKNVEVDLFAVEPGDVTTRDGLTFRISKGFTDAGQLDVLWTPGGNPQMLAQLMSGPDHRYLDFLKAQAAGATWVCSVCEGAMLLAAAGLLDGYTVTTHWAFIPCLKSFPAIKVAPGTPRYVLDRNRLTGGGISSGLDEALKLIELITDRATAEKVQQQTQYYPDPPVTSTLPVATSCPFSW